MITKLNPAVVNDKWGGVLYLELGETKPDNFEDIRSKLLEHINRQKYYSITVNDISWNLELNSPELIYSDGGNTVIMRQISFDDNFLLTIIEYYLYGDGNYVRRARNIDTVNTVSGKVDTVSGKVDALASTKQDVLTAGKGIVIDDNNTISINLDTDIFKVVPALPEAPVSGDENKIHLVLSSSSEEGNTYDEYIWVNNYWERIGSFRPSVDLSGYAEKSYVDSQIDGEATARTNADAELQTQINSKQEALTLTVKDNGNIVLANIQGQSKEFMPATPSGDPMHYYYISLGMKYDNGFFQLNGLNLTASEALDTLKSLRIVNKKDRTNGCRFLSFRTNIPDNYATTYTSTEQRLIMLACFAGIRTLEVVNIANNTNINYPLVCELGYAFLDCINLKKIIDYIKPTNVNHAFDSCSSLSSVNIVQLSISISFSSCPLLSSESVLFMVQNEAATSPITITLHADVYNRCMANADILAALETHTNISLASA